MWLQSRATADRRASAALTPIRCRPASTRSSNWTSTLAKYLVEKPNQVLRDGHEHFRLALRDAYERATRVTLSRIARHNQHEQLLKHAMASSSLTCDAIHRRHPPTPACAPSQGLQARLVDQGTDRPFHIPRCPQPPTILPWSMHPRRPTDCRRTLRLEDYRC